MREREEDYKANGAMRLMGLMGLIGLMGLMGACSSDHVPEPEKPEPLQTVIAFFANEQDEEVTRAGSTPLQNTGINSFRVWAVKNMDAGLQTYQKVMDEYRVRYADNSAGSSTTNSNSWDYILIAYPDQTPKYWDWEARAYRFFAVTGETTITGLNPAEDGTYQSYRAAFNADATNPEMTPYYSKLWFSTGNTTDYPTREFGKPVQLEFMQPFAKIRFMVILSEPNIPLKLENDDFRPTTPGKSIAKKANVTITYPMKGNGTTEQFEVVANSVTQTLGSFNQRWTEENETSVLPATTLNHYWETVLPATNQGTYTYKITVDGEEKSCIVPEQYMNWLPGYSYTYIFKVRGDGGVELATVRTSFTEWQEGVDKEVQLHNW